MPLSIALVLIILTFRFGPDVDSYVVAQSHQYGEPPKKISGTPYQYPWLSDFDTADILINRIHTPIGFVRATASYNSFADYLRHLPLKPGNPAVKLFNGHPKGRQDVHAAVIDIDVGDHDLQQCADALIRLRSEFLFQKGDYDKLAFNFTSGDRCSYSSWAKGYRPVIHGNNVTFLKSAEPADNYAAFRHWLDAIFNYAGSFSLSKELTASKMPDIEPGNVFIQGGFPGHGVMVMDVCRNEHGETLVLLAQSYMPAQDIHLLNNFVDPALSPWFDVSGHASLVTPEWTFRMTDLMHFE